jgi:hypothetical protein
MAGEAHVSFDDTRPATALQLAEDATALHP